MAGESPYIINEQGYVVSGAKTADYGSSFITPKQTGTGNADQMWNEGWNAGFNSGGSPVSNSDPNYSAGFSAGWQEYLNRNPTPPPRNPTLTTTNTNTNQGTSFDSIYSSMYPGWDRTAAEQDWIAKGRPTGGTSGGGGVDLNSQLRSQIEGGYNDYIGQLEGMYGGLGTQAESQNQIAQNSYQQSIRDLLANKQSSLGDIDLSQRRVEENQVKNLRDISNNIQNQYMAGNVMLGARGAGDSSAANQYSYALNRLGSKERGNVMNQTASSLADLDVQRTKLNNIVTQETSRLDTELGNAKQSISSWLAEQQNAIRQMIAQGRLNKSQEVASLTQNLLNQAISAYQTKQQEISNKRASLESWAMSNANNIQQLAQNMKSIGQFSPNMATAQNLNGSVTMDAQGNIRGLYGYGTSDEDKNSLYR